MCWYPSDVISSYEDNLNISQSQTNMEANNLNRQGKKNTNKLNHAINAL
jgi:hypothetical protein